MTAVPTRERPADRGSRHWTRALHEIGTELRDARLGAGLTQSHVAHAAGISQMEGSRIERGLSRRVPSETLYRMASVLGLRLSLKAYPEGAPLRDAAHIALLARLRARTHRNLQWRYEAPVTGSPGDGRAWDAEISAHGLLVRVEAETRLYDMQALERRLALKSRDARPATLLLLVNATDANRRLLRGPAKTLTETYPIKSRYVLTALASGRDPGGNAMVLL